MTYENPRIPEGINSGRNRPLRDLAVLGGGILGLLLALVALLLLLGQMFGPMVPFAWERALAPVVGQPGGDDKSQDAARLRALGDRVAAAMDLPDGMTVTVVLADLPMANAFATLGGQIFVSRRLVEAMPDENALAFVLGHEIGHVRHRDVMRSMTSTMLLSVLEAVVTGGDGGIADLAVGGGGMLGSLHFSRGREAAADAAATAALVVLYGHAGGYRQALETLRRETNDAAEPPAILASHPDIAARIAALDALANDRDWPPDGDRRSLP